ncbi:hypothetical protein Drorol1_Dr00000327, partial [Drosera rotundifolia]
VWSCWWLHCTLIRGISLISSRLISSVHIFPHFSSIFTLFTSVFFFPFCPSASELACVVFLNPVHPLLPFHPSPHVILSLCPQNIQKEKSRRISCSWFLFRVCLLCFFRD